MSRIITKFKSLATSVREPKPRPHNAKSPIDLRKHPVCYLCGGQWRRFDKTKKKKAWYQRGIEMPGLNPNETPQWVVNVQCGHCLFLSAAYADRAVMHSRGWMKHES